MSSRLFWAMESCIPRVLSELDLRRIGVMQAVQSEKAMTEQRKNLVLQLGEVYVIERQQLVQAEKGALQKLKALAQ